MKENREYGRARTNHLQVKVAGDAGLNREAGGEIEADKVERGTDNKVRDLSYSLCPDERNPMVGFGLEVISHVMYKILRPGRGV